MIAISKDKCSQGERVARIIHLLAKEGAKSHPELKERFPNVSESTLGRDIKLLEKTEVVVEVKQAKTVNGVISRKVFMFFKDDKDILGKAKRVMEDLKKDFQEVTLDQIASFVGIPPNEELRSAAYALAPKLGLLIGKDPIKRPPSGFLVGANDKRS